MIYISLLIGFTTMTLIVGIVTMAIGGKTSKKYSAKLMSLRVLLQAIAIGVIAVAYFLGRSNG